MTSDLSYNFFATVLIESNPIKRDILITQPLHCASIIN